jgi:hypothetical protein
MGIVNRQGKAPGKILVLFIISTETNKLVEVPFQKILYIFWDRAELIGKVS